MTKEWNHFELSEFNCKCCGENKMDEEFITKLDALREAYGKGLKVSSGYRCPAHNSRVSSTGPNGPHTTGLAVDFAVDRADAHKLLALAAPLFRGIGVNQKGSGRFLHLDDIQEGRPTAWSY